MKFSEKIFEILSMPTRVYKYSSPRLLPYNELLSSESIRLIFFEIDLDNKCLVFQFKVIFTLLNTKCLNLVPSHPLRGSMESQILTRYLLEFLSPLVLITVGAFIHRKRTNSLKTLFM